MVARFVAGRPRRQPTWLVGAIGQAAAVAAMAVIALTMEGVAAGVALLLALAVFASFRAVCSLTIKDVMGRTIPTGERGQVTGWATTASGLVAITVGLGIRALGQGTGTAVFAGLLAAGALLWLGRSSGCANQPSPTTGTPVQGCRPRCACSSPTVPSGASSSPGHCCW